MHKLISLAGYIGLLTVFTVFGYGITGGKAVSPGFLATLLLGGFLMSGALLLNQGKYRVPRVERVAALVLATAASVTGMVLFVMVAAQLVQNGMWSDRVFWDMSALMVAIFLLGLGAALLRGVIDAGADQQRGHG